MNYVIGIGGIALILLIAWVFSANRKWIRLRVVGAAFALQALMALLVLGTSGGQYVIGKMSEGVSNLLGGECQGTADGLGVIELSDGTVVKAPAAAVYGRTTVDVGVRPEKIRLHHDGAEWIV